MRWLTVQERLRGGLCGKEGEDRMRWLTVREQVEGRIMWEGG